MATENSQPIHIQEGYRYLANAQELLSKKAKKDGKFYSDKKYVRMAGNTAWNGVLEVMDGTFKIRESMKKNQRPDVDDYKNAILKKNQKMYRVFLTAYDTLHKSMGYDGNLSVVIVAEGMSEAKTLIEFCEGIS